VVVLKVISFVLIVIVWARTTDKSAFKHVRIRSISEVVTPITNSVGIAWTVTNRKDCNDWLVVYCFTSRSRIFHSYGAVTFASEGLQKSGLCSALVVFEQEGSLSCHTCCDTESWFSDLIRRIHTLTQR
jgi:hypothetical protein